MDNLITWGIPIFLIIVCGFLIAVVKSKVNEKNSNKNNNGKKK